ncbi:hypothetical protein HPP92_010954 [Vanilla planifolia]|uniref:Uncharacterized protein n=1 Tax=Vanilla planifolia TaxID=51239 RepID=A0A835QZZ7_VANPL|nr:hypothetical protein HPP92_011252 [Vanilla planifolia]KAG0482870.1 hypothetical protein HPP92_010954 [Vanilla planifolia]
MRRSDASEVDKMEGHLSSCRGDYSLVEREAGFPLLILDVACARSGQPLVVPCMAPLLVKLQCSSMDTVLSLNTAFACFVFEEGPVKEEE